MAIKSNSPKKGKIAISVANEILSSRGTNQKQQKELFKLAKSNDLAGADIRLLNNLMGQGLTFDKAKKGFKQYQVISVELAVDKEELKKYNTLNKRELIKAFIRGEVKPNPKLLPQQN